MSHVHTSATTTRLGYPADARLLIINADDFGMCHAVNAAIVRTLTEGVVSSTSVMVPCPWAMHAIQWLRAHPAVAFGVHLSVLCDGDAYRWGPLTPRDRVPSLLDATGYFYRFERMADFLAQVRLEHLEIEFRAQIEAVLAAGLTPTHLDWHSLRIGDRTDIADVMVGLAKDYGLAVRVVGRPAIENVQAQGLPTNDHDFLDSSTLGLGDKAARFAQLLCLLG